MQFSHTFIRRPIFAAVLSIFIIIVGGIAYGTLPVSQFPEVAPPTVSVTANYSGANAQVVADTVATVLEQEINGVENMIYMSSQSTASGSVTISVVFELGTNLDQAQVLVQNRVAVAEPRLPEEVRRTGITVRKNSPDLLMVVHMISPDNTYDGLYISNYALLQVRDRVARVKGVGNINLFGLREYSMRAWLDPDKIASLGMTASEVIAALQGQNIQVAGGALGQPPVNDNSTAFQTTLQLRGRLTQPEEFGEIVIKTGEAGRITRLRDVARIELGALDYQTNGYLDGKPAVVLAVSQTPGSNALEVANGVKAVMQEVSQSFPKGLEYRIIYNPTEFIEKSVEELLKTIFEAVALVVIVVLVFLQSWRATIIPVVAIPVSLIGTFAVLAGIGYSINNLTLFGLVLAVGIVVDDAIVVVENVERKLAEGLSPREASFATMDEVGVALISIALVLCAVFIPTAFLGGITGQFYRQFAVTIAVATLISSFNSLTLSPALCAILLKPHANGERPRRSWLNPARWGQAFFAGFNKVFGWLEHAYAKFVGGIIRISAVMLLLYAGLIGLAGYMFVTVPTGFVPQQDQGYLITAFELPPGASLARTDDVIKRAEKMILEQSGVAHTATFTGFSGATFTNASNAGAIFVTLKPFEDRVKDGLTGPKILADLQGKLFMQFQEAQIFVIAPPSVRGIGTGGGFAIRIQDRRSRGLQTLTQSTYELMAAANQTPGLSRVFTTFAINTPQVFIDVDRVRAQILDVPLANVFETLRIYLGSAYVNDFNVFGRTYRVTAQADAGFRINQDDIARLKTRSASGAMVPLGSVVTFRDISGPSRVPRYNLYPAIELQGSTAPGVSSGEGLRLMEELAARILPDGISYEWTDLSYQEKQSSGSALIVFGLAIIFVFLALAAQYESWTLPFAIVLIIPMCILSAILGVWAHGLDVNILTQIGFIVLAGLAAKNAILIIEFAVQLEDQGKTRFEAAVEACRLRLRPILMTSFAFTLGVVPLYIATGAGSEMRQALGTAVFYGMLGVTFFGLIFTPVFYVVVRGLFPGKKTDEPSVEMRPQPAE
ncbi:MAG: multidrug efflux RND transporter permease subunit [Hyphomicrobiales bacterium]|nr:multidrug efflux RND transporter permease subunit [Hyphomicrobiales bacterium]